MLRFYLKTTFVICSFAQVQFYLFSGSVSLISNLFLLKKWIFWLQSYIPWKDAVFDMVVMVVKKNEWNLGPS